MESLTADEREDKRESASFVTRRYVQFHVDNNGSSPRLERLLRKDFESNEEFFGIDHVNTSDSATAWAMYLIETHQFENAESLCGRILCQCRRLDNVNKLAFSEILILQYGGKTSFVKQKSYAKNGRKW